MAAVDRIAEYPFPSKILVMNKLTQDAKDFRCCNIALYLDLDVPQGRLGSMRWYDGSKRYVHIDYDGTDQLCISAEIIKI